MWFELSKEFQGWGQELISWDIFYFYNMVHVSITIRRLFVHWHREIVPYAMYKLLCAQTMVWLIAEVSDQNFIDEQIKGEKTSSICSSKILKTEKPDSSSRDQVSYDYKLQYCSGKFRFDIFHLSCALLGRSSNPTSHDRKRSWEVCFSSQMKIKNANGLFIHSKRC